LDREAVFPANDGWSSQVSLGKRNRIDYVFKYGNSIYGIEVKKGVPCQRDFEQALRYLPFLNGIFLAYPSERAAEAPLMSKKRVAFSDVGLISITLFRSHVTKSAKHRERATDQIWKENNEENFLSDVRTNWKWDNYDRIAATAIDDGCFWVSYKSNGKRCDLSRQPLLKSDWIGLALLYAANRAESMFKYFSYDVLTNLQKSLGWKGYFNLSTAVQCDLADLCSYSSRLHTFSISNQAVFLETPLRKAIKREIGAEKWTQLLEKIGELRTLHRTHQHSSHNEFIVF